MKVLELSSFVVGSDDLYFLGDISDRGDKSAECLDYLYSFPRFKAVIGNHDIFLYKFLTTGVADNHWAERLGGRRTIESFNRSSMSEERKMEIGRWVSSWPACRVLEDSVLVHGDIPNGFSLSTLIEAEADKSAVELKESESRIPLVWGRDYVISAFSDEHNPPHLFNRDIYLGHTPIGPLPRYSEKYRLHALDTGSCYEGGKLTLMDMDSHEFWQA